MNIDDPIKAAEALIASDERQASPVAEAIANFLSSIGAPGADKVAGFLDKRRAENRDLLLAVVRDEIQRVKVRFEDLSEEHLRFIQTDFVELVTDGLRKAENIRATARIIRIGKILGSVAEIGPAVAMDESEELMRIAMDLSDLDVAVLREIHRVQGRYLKDNQSGRVNRESANEAWRDSPPRVNGVSEGDIQGCCAMLQSFGLVARVERNDFKLGPNEIPYALLRRGAVFIEFIRNS
jgi:hypothetical protein